ncbi:MAG TPA: hypothetical protein ENK15_03905, partial [Thermopetrobacter sp.]|nr:hypothetical protein [Thermopetrobacter sp.]
MSKLMKKALLGTAAAAMMATGAAASELDTLKRQLSALNGPDAAVTTTYKSGKGLTIAITPTADLPAPATEITLSGSVTLAIWGDNTGVVGWLTRGEVNVKSKTPTAVGDVSTHIRVRGDFTGPGNSSAFYMHLAYADWQATENVRVRFGHAGDIDSVFDSSFGSWAPLGPASGPFSAFTYGRSNQLGVHFKSGAISVGLAAQQWMAGPGGVAAYAQADFGAGHVKISGAYDFLAALWRAGIGAKFTMGPAYVAVAASTLNLALWGVSAELGAKVDKVAFAVT